MSTPILQMTAGAAVLLTLLKPLGFSFVLRGSGIGSGGPFVSGDFFRGDRRLEVHYRRSLGQVQYHIGTHTVRHEPYMKRLGVWAQCRYPGFSQEPLQVFHDLSHDLGFAYDFTAGDGSVVLAAALDQKVQDDARSEALLADYQGQERQLLLMRSFFKQAKYTEVMKIFRSLPAPHLLTDAELQLVRIAQRRAA